MKILSFDSYFSFQQFQSLKALLVPVSKAYHSVSFGNSRPGAITLTQLNVIPVLNTFLHKHITIPFFLPHSEYFLLFTSPSVNQYINQCPFRCNIFHQRNITKHNQTHYRLFWPPLYPRDSILGGPILHTFKKDSQICKLNCLVGSFSKYQGPQQMFFYFFIVTTSEFIHFRVQCMGPLNSSQDPLNFVSEVLKGSWNNL